MQRLFSPTSIIATVETARPSDRLVLRAVLLAVVAALIWFIISLNNVASEDSIQAGGTLEEGIIGTPRFVNPVLALTRADQDVTTLVYRGLLHIDEHGELVPDQAASWSISADGLTHTLTLREDITFHDGEPVTAADVLFTVDLIKNDVLRSPLRGNWSGTTVESTDPLTVVITLEEPYALFGDNLTVGILPAHLWRTVPIEQVPFSTLNTTPVGSGPYRITKTEFGDNGTVTTYELERHTDEPRGFLTDIDLYFYTDESALRTAWDNGDITSSAYFSPSAVADITNDMTTVTEVPLTRTFALFLNQNKSELLRDATVREVLELVLDREAIIESSLAGSGIPITTAVQTGEDGIQSGDFHTDATLGTTTEPAMLAAALLSDDGWEQTEDGQWQKETDTGTIPLVITVRTANTPTLVAALDSVTEQWRALGVQVNTEQYTQSDLVQSVIRDRDFEIVLFGIDPGRNQDLYPFWHSSQQDDPGLNLTQYTNLTVDEALEDIRNSTASTTRAAAYSTINTVIQDERPVIFLYQPTVQYVTMNTITTPVIEQFSRTADRFFTITSWYAEERRLWSLFRTTDQPATTSQPTTN